MDKHRLNYRSYIVDMVPKANLLMDIKMTIGEAVKCAQLAMMQNIDQVTWVAVETVIDEVAKDNTGGQGGGRQRNNSQV